MENKAEKKDSKKPYETPKLTKFGKVEEVTQGGVGPVQDTAQLLGSR